MDKVAPPKRIGEPRGELAEPVLGAIAGRERKKIARYLMLAKDMMAGGHWNDPVTGMRIPSSIKTDGVWVWSRPWAFFVEEYGAALPADFLTHIRALRYRPPRLPDERVLEIGVAEGVIPSAEFFAEVARVQAEYDAGALKRGEHPLTHLARTAERIKALTWTYREEEVELRTRLMAEFLRRSALWARAYAAPTWPFPDLADAVDPDVRAPDEKVAQALDSVPRHLSDVRRVLTNALHFAALQDARADLPDLPDPYAPLLALLERGDAFGIEGTGHIEVDLRRLPRKDSEFWARQEPVVAVPGDDAPSPA